MNLLWITNPITGARLSKPRPEFPKGEYHILPGSEPDRYILTTGEAQVPLMVGKLEDCKDCAAACESDPLVLKYDPELDDLAGLSDNAASLVLLIRRVSVSGERLVKLLRHKVPATMLELEMSILRNAIAELSTSTKTTTVGWMR